MSEALFSAASRPAAWEKETSLVSRLELGSHVTRANGERENSYAQNRRTIHVTPQSSTIRAQRFEDAGSKSIFLRQAARRDAPEYGAGLLQLEAVACQSSGDRTGRRMRA